MDEATRAILTNERLIRVDQDPLGRQGRLVEARQGVSILRKPLADGSVAVGVFNERDQEGTAVCRWNDLLGAGDGAVVATDLWTGADTTVSGTGQVTVPPHATLVYQLRRAGA
jgi:alpha-galactosidase